MSEIDVHPIDWVESDVVKVKISLPGFVDSERIGLDVAHLERLCRIAGISELTIKSHSGSRSSGRPVILGVQKDGTAIGGFEKAASTTETNISKRDKLEQRICEWRKVSISIDMDYLTDEIQEGEGENSIFDWVKKLDTEISDNVYSSGMKVLMDTDPGFRVTVEAIFYAWLIVSQSLSSNPMDIQHILALLFSYGLGKAAIAGITGKMKDLRLSLVHPFGMELDRAAVFVIMSNVKSLVKEIVPEED
jgi:hypothetical protein